MKKKGDEIFKIGFKDLTPLLPSPGKRRGAGGEIHNKNS
jgi:hypothetical protein